MIKLPGQVIGRAGFLQQGRLMRIRNCGFVIGVPWQGCGYATEVCEALLQYGKRELGFERVQMLVMPENTVSLHLAEKLRFHRENLMMWEGVLYERLVREL